MDNQKLYEALKVIQETCNEQAIKPDTYMNLSERFMKGEIGEEEFVERYNRLIEQDAEKHWEPIRPHEHI